MIKIVTDSTHYLPPELVARYDIRVLPIMFSFGDQDYYEGVDLDLDWFFQRLAGDDVFPTTSQPSPEQLSNLWAGLLAEGHDIVTIVMSDRVSGTFKMVRRVYEQFFAHAPISVVDSASTAMGLGFQVLRAAELAQRGRSRDEIVAALARMRSGIQILLTPDTLENLRRGGRISAAKAWVGALLNVKPLLSFSRGFVEPLQQVRTTRRAQARMIELTLDFLGDDPRPWIAVMHSRSPERAQALSAQLQARYPAARFFCSEIGPSLGVHLGIGGTGIIVCRSSVLAGGVGVDGVLSVNVTKEEK